VDVDSILLLFLVVQFKIGIYAFWKLSKRLDKIERKNNSIKKAIIGLHKQEFEELRDSLHRINISMVETERKSLGMEIIDEEARRLETEIWFKGEG